MKKIKNWQAFNEGLFSSIKKGISDVYDFYKLVKLLRNWKEKYSPEEYDNVIYDAFKLIMVIICNLVNCHHLSLYQTYS